LAWAGLAAVRVAVSFSHAAPRFMDQPHGHIVMSLIVRDAGHIAPVAETWLGDNIDGEAGESEGLRGMVDGSAQDG
jgi:hypothetical protein